MEEEGEEERQEEAKEICGVLLPLLCASSHSHVDHTYTHTHTHIRIHTHPHIRMHIQCPLSQQYARPLLQSPSLHSAAFLPLPLFHSLSPTRVFRPHTQTHASPSFAGHLLATNCAEHRATAHSDNASPAVSLSLSLSSLSLSPTFPRASEARLSPSPPYMQ